MKRNFVSLMAAATVVAVMAGKANAGYTFDLRVTGGPTAATNDGHLVTNPAAGNYTVQLWGQISGDTIFTNDTWTNAGTVNVGSGTNGSGGLAFSGAGTGITQLAIASTWNNPSPGAQSSFTPDNVFDWGTNNTAATTGWTLFGATAAVVGGGAVGQQVNSNTWEMLMGTYTINVANVNSAASFSQQTAFSVGSPIGGVFAWSGPGKQKPVNVTIDGVVITGSGTTLTSTTLSVGLPVVFEVPANAVPEPASLGVLALGGLALLARRRKIA